MITPEVFVPSKLIILISESLLLVYFEFRLSSRSAIFFYLPCCWASRKPITSVELQICCELLFSGNTSSKTKICCRKKNSSLLCATCCLNLQHCILFRDKLVTNMVIRATMCFTLQCNNVAKQVKEKCCPYYRTFTKCFSKFMTRCQVNKQSLDKRAINHAL